MDCSPPGSSIHGILQARILEWVAISFSRGSSWPRDRTEVSCIAGRWFNLWATREAPLLCTWGQTMVEEVRIMVTSFRRSHACTGALSAPDPAPGYHWPTPPLETPGHSQASLGQSLLASLLLSPGSWCAQGFVCVLQESCVSPGGSMLGLVATSSKRAYATPRSITPRAPAPVAGHCWPTLLQETLKHSKKGLAQSLQGLLVLTRFCLSPLILSGGCDNNHLIRDYGFS